jgi:hypothetical protein
MTKEIESIECRFATHLYEINGLRPDTHVVKEVIHYKDGSKKNNLRLIKDFERSFWITLPHYQNHYDKKEYEDISKLKEHKSTQSKLVNNVSKLLGRYGRSNYIGELANSPYLYGTDISAASVIKKLYMDKYPETNTPYSVASFDTETSLDSKRDIKIASIAFEDKIFTAYTKEFVKRIPNPEEKVLELFKKHIPDKQIADNTIIEQYVAKDELDLVKAVFAKAHEWGPDFLSIWNMDFDIPVVINACERAGVDPANVFSDPELPDKYRHFKYKQGKKFKLTESGKFTPIPPEQQWHTVLASSKFYVIDAMCSYKFIRLMASAVPGGYSLDNILEKEGIAKKIRFKEAEAYKGAEWHQFMQQNYPIEYIIYNQWDCISMLELDKKTKDLTSSVPMFSYISEFSHFNSNPKRISDYMHYYVQEFGKILGSTPKDKDPNNEKLLGLKGWIVTLPANMIEENGLQVIEENSKLRTNIRAHVYDIDQKSGYPSNTMVTNLSKETTKRELINIKGIPKEVFKLQNINLLGGAVNAIEYCTTMFNLPNTINLLEEYKKETGRI